MQIIPAIDVLDGRVVRLTQGDFSRKITFSEDPLSFAKTFTDLGATRLHLVNLSGAKDARVSPEFLALVKNMTALTSASIQVGGGIRSIEDAAALLDAGATYIVLGTSVLSDPQEVLKIQSRFPGKCIAALDVDNEIVHIDGWQKSSEIHIASALEQVQALGIEQILITDISRDGMEDGPNANLYFALKRKFPSLHIIASGGVTTLSDISTLKNAECSSCVVGKALLNNPSVYTSFSKAASNLAIRVIPCLDVCNGRTVKGTQFTNLRDAGDPTELALEYCDQGADELVFLDISATVDAKSTAVDLATRVANAVDIPFTIGGGIATATAAKQILQAGADKVAINSAAIQNPDLLRQIAQEVGSANLVCAIDAKKSGDRYVVCTHGGSKETDIDAIAWAKQAVQMGAGELLVTSFDNDGVGGGYETSLLRQITSECRVPVIASGGAGCLQDFTDAIELGGASAVLAASVFHFGTFSIQTVKESLCDSGFPVRL